MFPYETPYTQIAAMSGTSNSIFQGEPLKEVYTIDATFNVRKNRYGAFNNRLGTLSVSKYGVFDSLKLKMNQKLMFKFLVESDELKSISSSFNYRELLCDL